ncbi:MAG: hypothetical protein K0R07_33 [Sedimentibacter sp.]|jgi:hypothetical protein|nr:hypothetical protein [Sedimentibacter sp.]
MTIQEREVLNEIKKIEGVLTTFKNGGDLMVNITTQQQLNVILGKLKEAYPSVKYPLKIDSCSGCIRNFLGDLLPVFDRLNKQEKQLNQIEMVGGMFEIIENATEEELANATFVEEVPEPKKVTRTRKGKK